jgi:hypothetical protein
MEHPSGKKADPFQKWKILPLGRRALIENGRWAAISWKSNSALECAGQIH